MAHTPQKARPRPPWNAREFLNTVEGHAVKIRKHVRRLRARVVSSTASGSMDDAFALADLVVKMARIGQQKNAADATEIAERVERLFDLLGTEVDELLASGCWHVV